MEYHFSKWRERFRSDLVESILDQPISMGWLGCFCQSCWFLIVGEVVGRSCWLIASSGWEVVSGQHPQASTLRGERVFRLPPQKKGEIGAELPEKVAVNPDSHH